MSCVLPNFLHLYINADDADSANPELETVIHSPAIESENSSQPEVISASPAPKPANPEPSNSSTNCATDKSVTDTQEG